MSEADLSCYYARRVDQVAHANIREAGATGSAFEAALSLYEEIPSDSQWPFVSFRRCIGRAYCLWKLEEPGPAMLEAKAAATHAADGGFIRFRAMSLGLQADIVEDRGEASGLRARAVHLARTVEDERLLFRAERPSETDA